MSTRSSGAIVIEEPVVRLNWRQVMAWRLQRHHLRERAPAEAMLAVAARIGGLHAQLMSSAELTLWARVEGLAPGAVLRALWEERSLVKSWAMRGTLHLLPAAEFPLWQAGLSTRYRHYLRPSWLRYFGVTHEELDQLMTTIARALDGRMLTREELAEEVARLTGSAQLGETLRHSWGTMLKPAAYRGHLCFAPSLGQNVRFTRPDQWLRGWQQEDPAHAMCEITRRYFAAYAPATRDDYARWWGMTAAAAKASIQGLGAEVTQIEVEGTRTWMPTEDVAEAAAASPPGSVRLLPAFDPYVIAASPHLRHLLPGDFRGRIFRPQGWVSPVLLVDGRMDGVWRHERKGKRLIVQIEPFVPLPLGARRAAEEEAGRLADFTGGALELHWQS